MSTKAVKTENKKTKKVEVVQKVESDSSDEEQPVVTQQTKKNSSKTPVKETKTTVKDVTNKDSDDESDSDDSDSDNELEQEAADDSESDDEEEKPKEKEKKAKESYDELAKRFKELISNKKDVQKKIADNQLEHKKFQTEANGYDREMKKLLDLLEKAHGDDVTRARKEKKSNRKGNANGGFNAPKPVPELLRNYLGLTEDTLLKLPQLMSRFNSKLVSSGQKDGQTAILNEKTLKALGLANDDGPRKIKFTEMMHFLAGFYPKKEKVEVEV